MTERAVVTVEEFDGPVREEELDVALEYAANARGAYKRTLDRDLLRVLVNTVRQRRKKSDILPMVAAKVARELIPYNEKKDALKYEAYKGAAMKVFSERAAAKKRAIAIWKAQRDAEQGAQAQRTRPEDQRKKFAGQYLLL